LDRSYIYDKVFGPYATQEEVFDQTVKPIVGEMLQGFNCTVFAYGQTGTGKTYTMEGELTDADNMGIIPRSVHTIFEQLESLQADYTVRVSFLELYNEELADLLVDGTKGKPPAGPGAKGAQAGGVVLRESRTGGVTVCGLEEVQVLDAPDIFRILERGIQQRRTAATLMNKNSSRSHSIFTLKIMIKELLPDGQEVMRNGQLNLVDLAGSECVGRSGATQNRAREAGNINQSLLTLGRVITALVEHHPHIPYRDSKLTRLLQESLGGRARTCLIATITSSSDAMEETLSSLDYALKAKSIENRPTANQKLTKKHMLKEYASEIESLRSMLQAAREKNGVYLDPAYYEQIESARESQKNLIVEQEGVIRSKTEEAKALKAANDTLAEEKAAVEELLEQTAQELRDTQATLGSTEEALCETRGALALESDAHAATRAQLARTAAALTATRHALTDARMELSATQAVVHEQEETEATLREQAAATRASLSAAAADVALLQHKIERQDAAAARRRAAALAYRDDAAAAAGALSAAVSSIRTLRAAALAYRDDAAAAALSAAVSSFIGQHRECSEGLRASLDAGLAVAHGGLTELANKLEGAMMQAAAASAATSGSVGGDCAAAAAQLQQAAAAVEQCLAEQQQGMESAQAQTGAALSKLETELATQELAEVRQWAECKLNEQAQALAAQKAEALAFARQRRADVQSQADMMVEAVSRMMADFKQKTCAEFEGHETTLVGNYDQSIAVCQQVCDTIATRVGEAGVKAAAWGQGLGESLHSVKEDVQRDIAQRRCDSNFYISDKLASWQVAAGCAAAAAAAEALSAATLESSTAAAQAALARIAAERAAAANMQDSMDICVQDLGSDHGAGVTEANEVLGAYVDGAAATQGPSGDTPCKKEYYASALATKCASLTLPPPPPPPIPPVRQRKYPFPAAFAHTRAHADIMDGSRNEWRTNGSVRARLDPAVTAVTLAVTHDGDAAVADVSGSSVEAAEAAAEDGAASENGDGGGARAAEDANCAPEPRSTTTSVDEDASQHGDATAADATVCAAACDAALDQQKRRRGAAKNPFTAAVGGGTGGRAAAPLKESNCTTTRSKARL
ncbi:P-loop containing nucleoside triphosphate hydrolase protein, partial [Tribonema minus]